MPELQTDDLEKVDGHRKLLNLAICLAVVSFVIWAAIFPLDMISMAQGTIKPSSHVQAIQHLEGGIIEDIKVKEGDTVKEGQELAVLQSVASGSDYGELLTRVNGLRADLARLEAEANGAMEPIFVNVKPEVMVKALSLFHARKQNLKSNIETKKSEIEQRNQDIAEITARLRNTRLRLKFAEEQVQIGKNLLAEKLSNRYEQLDRLKEYSSLKSAIEEDEASLLRATSARKAASLTVENLQTGYQQDVETQLSERRNQYLESSQRLEKYQDSFQRAVLRAPKEGVVKAIYISTKGAVLRPGDTVMDLVPQDDALIVEAQLLPQDIGHVQVGQKSFIQLASNDASRFGRIEGEVEHISADTLQTEEGEPYYEVRIITKQNYFQSRDKRYDMVSGVLVSAGIVTGQRSVLEYIFSPLLTTMPFALGEL